MALIGDHFHDKNYWSELKFLPKLNHVKKIADYEYQD